MKESSEYWLIGLGSALLALLIIMTVNFFGGCEPDEEGLAFIATQNEIYPEGHERGDNMAEAFLVTWGKESKQFDNRKEALEFHATKEGATLRDITSFVRY